MFANIVRIAKNAVVNYARSLERSLKGLVTPARAAAAATALRSAADGGLGPYEPYVAGSAPSGPPRHPTPLAPRPHQGLHQKIPDPVARLQVKPSSSGQVVAKPILGGLHHDYRGAA